MRALLLVPLIALTASFAHPDTARTSPDLPRTVLWAWERREDLRTIDPSTTGVAYLARTLVLTGDRVDVRPRMQPLLVPDGVRAMAVVRIETARDRALSKEQRGRTIDAITAVAADHIAAVQIDFDATTSERQFYADLLTDLRRALPARLPISMTALASWCLDDPWIDGLPVFEAVPMLFDMGVDDGVVRRRLRHMHGFTLPMCKSSVGIAAGDPVTSAPRQRTYIFNRQAWTADAVASAIEGRRE